MPVDFLFCEGIAINSRFRSRYDFGISRLRHAAIELHMIFESQGLPILLYRVYQIKRNLGISQEIDIVLKTKDFRRLRI
jgi:hypothetical protein